MTEFREGDVVGRQVSAQNEGHWARHQSRAGSLWIAQPVESRFWSRVMKTEECWEWTASKHPFGYGQMSVNGKSVRAHRLSWELHFGAIPDGAHVCHRCDNPACVRPEHLFLGDHQANMADMTRKGRNRVKADPSRAARGQRIHCAKLTEAKAAEARRRVLAGETRTAVAADLGVSLGTVSKICKGYIDIDVGRSRGVVVLLSPGVPDGAAPTELESRVSKLAIENAELRAMLRRAEKALARVEASLLGASGVLGDVRAVLAGEGQ